MSRRFVFGLLILCLNSCVKGQNIDRINIYLIPFETDYLVDNLDGNDVRVKADYCIAILIDSKIKEITSKLNQIKKEVVLKTKQDDFTRCRLVIDLVSKSKIKESYIFNTSYQFITDEVSSEISVYKWDEDFLCYLRGLFPGFIQLYHDKIKCIGN